MLATTPAQRFRLALTSPKATVKHLERLAARLPNDDVRACDSRGVTSLAVAAAAGNLEVCEWLLLDEGHEEGEISRDAAGETIVHIAAARGFVQILDLYLSQYPFVVDWVDSRGATPLHLAAMTGEAEAARILIDYAGPDLVDAPDLFGSTPLHYASSYGKLSVCKLLVEQDCDVTTRNNEGFTAGDYAFSFAVLKGLEESIRAHAEEARRQRHRKQSSPKAGRSLRHASSSVMAGADDASAHGSVPATPPVGLGFGFDPNVAHSQPATANSSPSRSLRPPISPTRQRSSSSNYFSDRVSPAPSTSNVPFATPPATANPGGSRPGTPSLSPLSLKRLSRGLSSRSTHNTASGPPSPAGSGRRVAPSEASAVDNFVFEQGGLGTATLKAPIRSKSHSVLPGEAGNDLVPVQPPSRSVSMKVDSRAGGGGRPGWSQPPRPLPLNLQQTSERSRSESNQSGVSSGESSIATPPTGPSRAESTLSSPARSRSNSTAQPLLPLSSSSANAQPSPPPSPSITSSSIAGLLKGGKKERERKASITAAGEADPRSRSGSNESQTSGSRVARALGLGRRQA